MSNIIIINKETGEVKVTGDDPCFICDDYKTCDQILKLNCKIFCG